MIAGRFVGVFNNLGQSLKGNIAIHFIIFSQIKNGGYFSGKIFLFFRKSLLADQYNPETFFKSRNTDHQLFRCHNHSQNAHINSNIINCPINSTSYFLHPCLYQRKYAIHKAHLLHYLNNAYLHDN